MNKDHIDEVIASIRGEHARTIKLDVGFNMSDWVQKAGTEEDGLVIDDKAGHACGTVACIAGHAYLLADRRRTAKGAIKSESCDVIEPAMEYLDLDHNQANSLFYAYGTDNLDDITADQAITTLKKLKATGLVDWSHTRTPDPVEIAA